MQQYSPHAIAGREFLFSGKTSALMADAELAFARIDERSVRYPYSSSLRRALARLESVSTVCIDGVAPHLQTVILLNAVTQAHLENDNNHAVNSILARVDDADVRKAMLEAFRYGRVIEDISLTAKDRVLTEQNLLRWHAILRHGKAEDGLVRYRKHPYRTSKRIERTASLLYLPPEPNAVGPLMRDLFAFAADSTLSPVTQAAVAHFQLEAICPFKTAMDRTGRVLVHGILRHRGFYEHIIPPIALVPAMDISRHAKLLLPYRTGQDFTKQNTACVLDKWVQHCALCISLSARLTSTYMNSISQIADGWKASVGDYRQGSAIDILLQELPGAPILTIPIAMALTGKGFSAANEAVERLVKCGILQAVGQSKRNRIFQASEVLEKERMVLSQTIPQSIKARESFCSQ